MLGSPWDAALFAARPRDVAASPVRLRRRIAGVAAPARVADAGDAHSRSPVWNAPKSALTAASNAANISSKPPFFGPAIERFGQLRLGHGRNPTYPRNRPIGARSIPPYGKPHFHVVHPQPSNHVYMVGQFMLGYMGACVSRLPRLGVERTSTGVFRVRIERGLEYEAGGAVAVIVMFEDDTHI